jgi:hypothetical protein
MGTKILQTIGDWPSFSGKTKSSEWFHHMLEKMLNSKDSIWKANLNSKSPRKEPLPKK